MAPIVLFADAGDDLLDQFDNALDVTQTPIEDLPVKPESRALDNVCKFASRILVHESCDCWHDAYVLLWIDGKLYRLLVEFKPCFPILKLGWLSSVVSGLELVVIYTKDQARVLGPDFYDVPRAKRPDGASILVSTDEKLLLLNRETLAASFGGLVALVNNVLRLYDPRKPKPDVVWLTTREPNNYLVVDDGGDEVYLLVFRADGAFVKALVFEPVRTIGVGYIQSLGGVRRTATLKEAAMAFGAEDPVELGRWTTHAILSEHASSVVCIGPIDNMLDDAIEAKFEIYGPPNASSPFLVLASWWTNALSTDVFEAYAAETPTDAQKQILADERKAIASLSGSAKGMAGHDERATNVAMSSLLATGEWFGKHKFDAGAVRASGHHALHFTTYAWAHDCTLAEGKVKLGEAAGTLVFETPHGVPIHADDAAWQAGHRPTVALIYYEKDDSGSVEAQVLRKADALAIVETMADDEAKEETKEESEEEEESDAPAAQRARTTS